MSSARASQLIEAGVWLQATGDQDGARRLFEQALKIDPSNARAKQYLSGKNGAPRSSAPLASTPTPPPIPPVAILPPVVGAQPAVPPAPVASAFAVPAEAEPNADFEYTPGSTVMFGIGGTAPTSTPRRVEPPPSNPFAAPPPREGGFPFGVGAVAPEPKTPVLPRRDDAWFDDPTPAPDAPPAPAQSAWDAGGAEEALIETTTPRDGLDPLSLVTQAHTPIPFKDPTPSEAVRIQDELTTLIRGAEDLVGLDDHSGALELIVKALELDPYNQRILALKQRSEQTLLAMYESRLGPMDACPHIVLKQDEIIWLNLDHRAGFVLAQIDGAVTFDDLFAICGMTRLDTARILAQLVEEGVIAPA